MISVVVPAYNEQAVIERCLHTLTNGAPAGGLEVVVVANGCRDRTAEVARGVAGPIRVLSTPVGSKTVALNMGDEAVSGFPRFYVDADVVVSYDDLAAVAREMEQSGKPVGAPRLRMVLDASSWGVRAYYAVWLRLSFHQAGMIGCGVYGLTREGRQRFGEFPDVVADDAFVRCLFVDAERARPANAFVAVRGPSTLRDLIKIKTRSRLGLSQLRERYPERFRTGLKKDRLFFKSLLPRPWLWPAAAVYLYVNLVTRRRARRQQRAMTDYQWERDESTRQDASGTSTPASTQPSA